MWTRSDSVNITIIGYPAIPGIAISPGIIIPRFGLDTGDSATVVQLAGFIIDVLSMVCLAIFIITCVASETLRDKRHPTMLNLFLTLLLYSTLKVIGYAEYCWYSQVTRDLAFMHIIVELYNFTGPG
ncbi:MAG TPA: hypothetical protein VGO47_07690 [Chlamydiales bacterium]|jgi:hypothetical protein|nr:hypothetical protein [Chlamydiales bacterium]